MHVTLSEFDAITDDSREVGSNTLFCAYPGTKLDGRAYIKTAIDRGATGVLYESEGGWQPPEALKKKAKWFPISGLQARLGDIASQFYGEPALKIPVVGITGTNGKTSCAQFMAQALSFYKKKYAVLGTIGNGFLPDLIPSTHTTLNPIKLQKNIKDFVDQGADGVVMEVSSHALEQGRVNGVCFEIAVLTNLSRDHLDYHGSMQAYADAKEKLFHFPGLRYAVINFDDAFGKQLLEKSLSADVFLYSAQGQVHPVIPTIAVSKIDVLPDGFRVDVLTPWGEGTFETSLMGRFNVSNLLAVLTVLCLSGVPLFDALYFLSKISPVAGRMQALGGGAQPFVIIDYAHTPDALEKTLMAIQERALGKIICVFGCGGDRDTGKRALMASVAERYADNIIITNDNPRTESPEKIVQDIQAGLKNKENVAIILDREKAIKTAVQMAKKGDMVLIAGKGHENYQIINHQTLSFDDRLVAQAALRDFSL